MENINVEVEALTSKLQSTTIPNGSGVSFVGQGLKLNNADDAKTIVNEINQAGQVEFLNMEGNSLGVDAAKEIGKALEKRKEFKRALWKDMFTSRLKTEIPIALKHLTGGLMLAGAKLEVLDLSDNASGPIGVEGFEEFLRSSSCYSLRELRLNNMGLGVTGAKKLASALLDLYNNSKNAGEPLQLEVFIAGRNRLENPGASALAQVFQKIGTLKEISIPQNGIYHYGISALSAAFNENLTLQVINLNDNTVTEKGARALSKALCNLNNLKSLDLGDCLLRSEGALAIAESVCKLQHLESLNLSFNEVKAEAGSRVINTLAPLSTCLSTLNMDGNMFGPSMCDEITSVAQQLKLPLAPLNEDEGGDGEDYDDDEHVDDEEDEEDDEDGEEEEEEDLDDTESDQPYNLDNQNKVTEKDKVFKSSTPSPTTPEINLVTSLLENLCVSSPQNVFKPQESNPTDVISETNNPVEEVKEEKRISESNSCNEIGEDSGCCESDNQHETIPHSPNDTTEAAQSEVKMTSDDSCLNSPQNDMNCETESDQNIKDTCESNEFQYNNENPQNIMEVDQSYMNINEDSKPQNTEEVEIKLEEEQNTGILNLVYNPVASPETSHNDNSEAEAVCTSSPMNEKSVKCELFENQEFVLSADQEMSSIENPDLTDLCSNPFNEKDMNCESVMQEITLPYNQEIPSSENCEVTLNTSNPFIEKETQSESVDKQDLIIPSYQELIIPSDQEFSNENNMECVAGEQQELITPSNQELMIPSNQELIIPSDQELIIPSNQEFSNENNMECVAGEKEELITPSDHESCIRNNMECMVVERLEIISPPDQEVELMSGSVEKDKAVILSDDGMSTKSYMDFVVDEKEEIISPDQEKSSINTLECVVDKMEEIITPGQEVESKDELVDTSSDTNGAAYVVIEKEVLIMPDQETSNQNDVECVVVEKVKTITPGQEMSNQNFMEFVVIEKQEVITCSDQVMSDTNDMECMVVEKQDAITPKQDAITPDQEIEMKDELVDNNKLIIPADQEMPNTNDVECVVDEKEKIINLNQETSNPDDVEFIVVKKREVITPSEKNYMECVEVEKDEAIIPVHEMEIKDELLDKLSDQDNRSNLNYAECVFVEKQEVITPADQEMSEDKGMKCEVVVKVDLITPSDHSKLVEKLITPDQESSDNKEKKCEALEKQDLIITSDQEMVNAEVKKSDLIEEQKVKTPFDHEMSKGDTCKVELVVNQELITPDQIMSNGNEINRQIAKNPEIIISCDQEVPSNEEYNYAEPIQNELHQTQTVECESLDTEKEQTLNGKDNKSEQIQDLSEEIKTLNEQPDKKQNVEVSPETKKSKQSSNSKSGRSKCIVM